MNTNNFFIADPYNETHINLFNNFESINDKNKPVTTYLTGINKAYDKITYANISSKNNEINIICFTMAKNEIKDYCYIKGEKDRKVCELFFAHLKDKTRKRTIMEYASNYALNALAMEQVFVSIDNDNSYLYDQLLSNGYEDIGEVNGNTTFIKEKEEVIEMSKVI